MSRMGISDFYSAALSLDFSRDFSMRVVDIGNGVLTEGSTIYIKAATLPGYEINNITDVKFMGLPFNLPGSGFFPGSDSWDVRFYADESLNIREILIDWQKTIFNSFPGSNDSVGEYGPKYTESTVTLVVLDKNGDSVRTIKLIGAYPKVVGQVEYNMQGGGTPVEVACTLAYQWWTESMDVNNLLSTSITSTVVGVAAATLNTAVNAVVNNITTR